MKDILENTEATGRSLANRMILIGLLTLLRDKGVISSADVRGILSDADKTLASRARETSVQGARPILEVVGRLFREPA